VRRLVGVIVALMCSCWSGTALAQVTPSAALDRGYEMIATGDRLGAVQYFEQLQGARPGDVASAFGALGARHSRLNQDDSEQGLFEQRLDQFITTVTTRYSRNKRDDDALFYLAQAHMLRAGYRFEFDKGMWGAARDAANAKNYSETYVARHPEHSDAYMTLGLYNYYVSLAPSVFKAMSWLLFLPSGNRAEGLKQLERAASTGHWFAPRAKLLLMDIYGTLEHRPADALALARALQQRYPNNDQIGFNLADVYLAPSVEDRAEAARVYQRIIDGHQGTATIDVIAARLKATIGLAALRQDQWQIDEAIALLTPIIDSRVDKPAWALPQALLRRSNYLALLNDPGATKDLQVILGDPKMAKWHESAKSQMKWIQLRAASGEAVVYTSLLVGNRLAAEKRWAEAVRAYEPVRARDPQNPQVRYRLAYVKFASGDSEGALPEMTALGNGPKSVPEWLRAGALLIAARAHDLAGRRELAKRTYQIIVDRYEHQRPSLAARLGLVTPYARPASTMSSLDRSRRPQPLLSLAARFL
jgi:hypothetical protein